MKHRELVAMISSGISLRRVAMPVLLCTLALLGAQVACKELVLPRLAPLLVRDKQDIGPQSGAMTRSFLRDTEGRIWYIQRADIDPRSPDRATLRNISVYERDEQGLMTRRITASSAEWEAQGDALSTEHHWALTGGVAAARVRADSSAGPAARVQNSPAYEIRSSVTPTTLRHYRWDSMASNLSSPQLRELIASTRSGAPTPAEVRREHNLTRLLYGRWSNTLCVLLSVIMGLPFFLRKEPANMVRQTLIAAPQSLAAFALTLVGTTADMPGIPPGVSVFLPAMFLLPAAIVAWGSIKT